MQAAMGVSWINHGNIMRSLPQNQKVIMGMKERMELVVTTKAKESLRFRPTWISLKTKLL